MTPIYLTANQFVLWTTYQNSLDRLVHSSCLSVINGIVGWFCTLVNSWHYTRGSRLAVVKKLFFVEKLQNSDPLTRENTFGWAIHLFSFINYFARANLTYNFEKIILQKNCPILVGSGCSMLLTSFTQARLTVTLNFDQMLCSPTWSHPSFFLSHTYYSGFTTIIIWPPTKHPMVNILNLDGIDGVNASIWYFLDCRQLDLVWPAENKCRRIELSSLKVARSSQFLLLAIEFVTL